MSNDKTISIGFSKGTRIGVIALIFGMSLLISFTGTVAAADDNDTCEQRDIDGDGEDEYDEDCPGYGLCNTPFLSPIVNFIGNLVVYGGVIMGLIGYAGAGLISAIPYVGTHFADSVKQWQGNAIIAIGKVLIIPAIVLAVLSVAGIGIPACVNFAFWS